MSFDGAGTYSPPAADFPVVTLTTVSSTHFNNTINDMSTALSLCVTRSGQSPWTGNLPAGGFKITGMAAGTLRGDSVRAAEAQDGTYTYGGTAGGTADALTFSLAPAITAYVLGQVFVFKSSASPNTTAATLAINGIATPKAIQRDGAALVAGDIEASKFYLVLYDGTAFQLHRFSPSRILTTKGDLIGSATGGVATRLPVGTDGQTLSADSTATLGVAWSTPAFTAGDVKITIKTVADTGWVLMNDTTIGNAASGATGRANADTVALYTLLYNNTVNADCAVSGGRGANAAADYAANKTIALPKTLGRALACFGTGSGLTARTMAKTFGVETHPLVLAEGPPHSHTLSVYTGGGNVDVAQEAGSDGVVTGNPSTSSSGSGTAHQNMQPSIFLNVMIKL